ncbi:hypothetical protein RCF98_00555 [Thiothrix lacustris]|uniref:Uncharacterized protein n=1 Tax=Thiothrix lacustris TaxID=525917 RepID=A0ABY9MQD1_9GAMM|nr:hypothetical protein [Thiothrix lacustris]WML90859.1 hypothetical protein RCF98_00555 [Thiothrix lacustris]
MHSSGHIEKRIVGLIEKGDIDGAAGALLFYRRRDAAHSPRIDDTPERKSLRKEFHLLSKAADLEKDLKGMSYEHRKDAQALIKNIRAGVDGSDKGYIDNLKPVLDGVSRGDALQTRSFECFMAGGDIGGLSRKSESSELLQTLSSSRIFR